MSADPQISLKGTQVSPYQKQSSLLSSPAKPQLTNTPAKPQQSNTPAMSSRVMRNSSSLRAKGGDATFPGLAELVTLGPDSVPGGAAGIQVCLTRVHAGCYCCFVLRMLMSIYIGEFIACVSSTKVRYVQI